MVAATAYTSHTNIHAHAHCFFFLCCVLVILLPLIFAMLFFVAVAVCCCFEAVNLHTRTARLNAAHIAHIQRVVYHTLGMNALYTRINSYTYNIYIYLCLYTLEVYVGYIVLYLYKFPGKRNTIRLQPFLYYRRSVSLKRVLQRWTIHSTCFAV